MNHTYSTRTPGATIPTTIQSTVTSSGENQTTPYLHATIMRQAKSMSCVMMRIQLPTSKVQKFHAQINLSSNCLHLLSLICPYSKVVLMQIFRFYSIVIDFSVTNYCIYFLPLLFFCSLSIAPRSMFDMSIVQTSFVFFSKCVQ